MTTETTYIDKLAAIGGTRPKWDLSNIVEVPRDVWDELVAVVRVAEDYFNGAVSGLLAREHLAALKAKVEAQ